MFWVEKPHASFLGSLVYLRATGTEYPGSELDNHTRDNSAEVLSNE